jgi:eukaryotic-like serine/threonine-protein kinase
MPMTAGEQLGHYTIQSLIGKGGMGEVYRALDTKLDRSVAIKVVPDAFAGDPDRLARFEREAKVLAQLNHPGIASIYGVEDRPHCLCTVRCPLVRIN